VEVVALFASGCQQIIGLSLAREEQDLAGRALFLQAKGEINSRQSRHHDVRNDEVGLGGSSGFESLQRVHKRTSIVTTELENGCRGRRYDSIIVDDKDT
jgi:hypothetical protein